MSQHIILISCSNGKTRGGDPAYNPDHSVTAVFPSNLKTELLRYRQTIAEWIKGGHVEDLLRGDGNRGDSRYNIELELGPDLGYHSDGIQPADIKYLPAYQRYDGRFFAFAGENAFEQAILEDSHVIIISGLYGFLLPEELIQAYSCHLDDEVIIENRSVRISEIWRQNNLPVRVLKTFIDWHDQNHDHTIDCVVDLLSETSYQRLFDWNELYPWFKKKQISWFHRAVKGVREPAFLADLGRWFRHNIVEQGFSPPSVGKIAGEYLHTINAAKGHLEFKKLVQPDPYTEILLQREFDDRTWQNLDRQTRADLIHGELFFQLYDARSNKQPGETAPRIVNFFSALEIELYLICHHISGKGSLGNFAYHLCKGQLIDVWPDKTTQKKACESMTRLMTIRNCMSHRGVVTRAELLEARSEIIKRDGLLSEIVKIKLNTAARQNPTA
jgi:hypothetical protein